MPPKKSSVGLIVPSSNTVMEPDFHRCLDHSVIVSTTRIFLENVTREAEQRMLREELPRSLELIKAVQPQVVVFGCTSAGSLGGLDHDAGIARQIGQQTGAQAITVVGAVLQELQWLRAQKVAVLTPYREELTRSVAESLAEGGYSIVKMAGMGILDNCEIGGVEPAAIEHFVESHMVGVETDCLFLSCTNWRASEVIERLREKLHRPVISSNQATLEVVRRLLACGKTHSTIAN